MKTLLPADEKRSRRRRAVLFVSLVVVVLVGFVVLAISMPHHASPRPSTASRPASPWLPGLVFGGIVASLATLVGLAIYSLRSQRAAREEHDVALSLLARGALTEARARFEALAARRWLPGFSEVAKYHLAVVSMRLGDLDGARARFQKVQRSTLGGDGWVLACLQLGVCLALSGELPAAEAWLAEAEVRAARIMTTRIHFDLQLLFARGLYDCRRGAAAEAARILQSRWRDMEASLSGEAMRPCRVLRAFAVASSSGPRESAQVEPLLLPLRGGAPGEFAWLGTRWPEMQSFLAAYSL